eukprot:gene1151-1222_t
MSYDGKILAEYIQGDFKLSMWIPSDLAGRVVGKRGVVITNLQRETRAKLMNALSPVGESLWIAVVIIGDWKSIIAAYKAVSEIVAGEVDDVVLEFLINYRKLFFLYRRGKADVLKEISAKTNVRIFLPELIREGNVASHIEPMTLEGSFENVQRAVNLIESEANGKESTESQISEVTQKKETLETNNNSNPSVGPFDSNQMTYSAIKVSSKEKKTLERKIEIPLNLVGLLLSRKPQLKISILNQLQGMTFTIISKILPTAEILGKETAAVEEERDEKINLASSGIENVTTDTNEEIHLDEKEKETGYVEEEFVPFKIVGYNDENINMAYEHLERIIKGERIKNVLEALKLAARKLPRPVAGKDKSTKFKSKK